MSSFAQFVISELVRWNPLSNWVRDFRTRLQLFQLTRHRETRLGRGCILQDVTLGRYNGIGDHAELFGVSLGDFSYVGEGSTLSLVDVGRFCSIGPGVRIGLGMHPARRFVSSHPAFFTSRRQVGRTFSDAILFEETRPVSIGNDVWIGANVLIVDGVHIADGAIVAGGAVVSKDVAPYTIVGGVPARPIGTRFSPDQIQDLLRLRWWEWPEQVLAQRWRAFQDIDSFVAAFGSDSAPKPPAAGTQPP